MLGAYKLTSGVQWGENKYIHIAIEEGEISCYVWKNAHYTAYQQGSLRFGKHSRFHITNWGFCVFQSNRLNKIS